MREDCIESAMAAGGYSSVTFITVLRGRQQVAAVSCGVVLFGDLFVEVEKQL